MLLQNDHLYYFIVIYSFLLPQQGYLHKAHALFSTSVGDMTAKPAGRTSKQLKNDIASKQSPDEQIADMKILRTLAKYLWLKDNAEFRFRVVMALGLLVGAKVSATLQFDEF